MDYQKSGDSKKGENANGTSCSKNHGYEVYQTIPVSIGKGGSRENDFGRGLTLFITACQTNGTHDFYMEEEVPYFGFYFCLAGNRKLKIQSFKKQINLEPFHCALFNFPGEKRLHEFTKDTYFHIVFISISHDHVLSLLGNNFKEILPNAILPVDGNSGDPFHIPHTITYRMNICLQQIINCSYNEPARKFFLEAKTLELIACQLDLLNLGTDTPGQSSALKAGDIERIHYAGELLKIKYQNPPSIIELSRKIGISRTKLYNEFCQVFGISPIAYIRAVRMGKAEKLIQEGYMNKTEIAHFLGFSSASNFTRTFKIFFGVLPSQYL